MAKNNNCNNDVEKWFAGNSLFLSVLIVNLKYPSKFIWISLAICPGMAVITVIIVMTVTPIEGERLLSTLARLESAIG